MVLPLLGKKFDRAAKKITVIGLEGVAEGEEVETGGEEIGFAAELPRSEAGKIQRNKVRAPYWEGRARQI